jgi:3'-phosphoadenosine 5'-phosphosulfate (PAPS) 3'-phosphatase/mannose-6-phosphate isomerase-like protein (cupin superfamily)
MAIKIALVIISMLLYPSMQLQVGPIKSSSIYTDLGRSPALGREKVVDILRLDNTMNIQTIKSKSFSSDFVAQDDSEFVFLVEGHAQLEFDLTKYKEKDITLLNMTRGSYVYIPQGVRHRVVQTSKDPAAVWIAIHHNANIEKEPGLMSLLDTIQSACHSLSELVNNIYSFYLDSDSDMNTLSKKSDDSAFTIVDGLVEYMLRELLNNKVGHIVGEEEDSIITIDTTNSRYFVNNMQIPHKLHSLVDDQLCTMRRLCRNIHPKAYQHLSVFIDPIDGTKEFINGHGEQCTICVGFSDDRSNEAVAGFIMRPMTGEWAAGAPCEKYKASSFSTSSNESPSRKHKGIFICSQNGVSDFTKTLSAELDFLDCRVGGAGNKILLLLEGKGSCYIQDRGLNRWDTCACEAVLNAHGGELVRLDTFIDDADEMSAILTPYTYKKTRINLDPNPNAKFTKYNYNDDNSFKPYSNLCGLLALAPSETTRDRLAYYKDACMRTVQIAPPSYN